MMESDQIVSATFAILVENESGALARVIGLFSGRGYNIESLTVAPVGEDGKRSRINIVTSGTPMVIAQIKAQLNRLVPVYKVANLSQGGEKPITREMLLIKVEGHGESRSEALRLAEAYRARVVDATTHSFVFELTGSPSKLDTFVNLMYPLGLVEVSRTGVVAMSRGSTGL
ncbi:acetolactate synthase small subunit [Entomobacter blattae]|uniref:Acetolactate synthase small subunit n=1 Tax=Entomobacter blattae TaxID=2762277 RepID=A0A7H1NRF1_9PROT|nr:acetolactate synthase small subunit [Entomobacter blattae]QNT78361.1 Acetolactate synthase isozyme 3 small subunit [Entomobacter blattae]